jgi:hypothetical protein
VGSVVLLAVGAVLVLLGVVIWRGRLDKRELAVGNAVSAVLGIVWLTSVSGFSGAGTVLVAVTISGLAGLAAAQLATLRT